MKFRIRVIAAFAAFMAIASSQALSQQVFRIGMIGLDTSHVVAFTKQINDPSNNYGCKVVAAFKGGSPDIPSSADRIEGYTKEMVETYGVEIVGTIEELCRKVDGVMLESVDGRPHLEQVRPVIAAGKPVFIDKPMAASLEDVISIFRLAESRGVPCWSSSSLRFSSGVMGVHADEKIGMVLGCDAFSPCSLEPHHPDLYWYGVHGVEILYTIMGTGCRTVSRIQTPDFEKVVGVWNDGRIGTFRGLRKGRLDYGAYVFGEKGNGTTGGYTGYGGLVEETIMFFKTGKAPVPASETIEMFAFMTAADVSKSRNGAAVSIDEVIKAAEKNITR